MMSDGRRHPNDIPVTDALPRAEITDALIEAAATVKALGLVGQRSVYAAKFGKGQAVFVHDKTEGTPDNA